MPVDGEPCEDRDRDRVVARHALAGLLGRFGVVELAREQGVEGDDAVGVGQGEGPSGVASFALPCVAKSRRSSASFPDSKPEASWREGS